ncbi:MAG: hypothetical protein N2439_06895, partial [Anaerolineae bacterium]|nr:hypothetical protein [Anaerolineae bacterium]
MIKGIGINCDDEHINGRLDRLDEALARAHQAGFAAYELSLPACNVIRSGRVDEDELRRTAKVMARYPLRYTAVSYTH